MRDFLNVFVPAFLLFAVIGGIAGCAKRYERAKTKVYRTLEVRFEEGSGEAVLVSACEEPRGVRFRHRVDADATDPLSSLDRLLELQTTSLGPASLRHMELAGLLGGFLGGATGGFRLKDVLKQPATKGWKKTIWGLVGAITGYAVGYLAVSNFATGCDSRFMSRLRDDREAWIAFERMKLALSFKELQSLEGAWLDEETGRPMAKVDRDPVFRCAERGLAEWRELARETLGRKIENPVSQDFRALDVLKSFHDRLCQTTAYETLVKLRHLKEADVEVPDGIRELGYSKEAWDKACAELAEVSLFPE